MGMDVRQDRDLARAQIRDPILYRIFGIVFAAVFGVVVLLCVLMNTNTFAEYTWYWLLLAAVGGVLAAFAVSRLWNLLPALSRRGEVVAVVVLFVAYAALQAFVGWKLRVQPTATWDFGLVYTYASDYVLNGVLPDDYFLRCMNNTGLYALFCGFFSLLKLMGVTDFTTPAFVLNLLAIDGALVLLYFCGRRMFGAKRAIFLLLCAFFTLPFIAYVPVYYTDTLTLPFPIAAVLMWLHARAHWREGRTKRAWGLFLAVSALCAVGALLKMTVIIVWVAIVLDLLILLCGKGRLLMLLAGLAVTVGIAVGGTFGLRYIPMLPRYDYDKGMPLTLWVLMGLEGDGGYDDDSFQLALTKETKTERAELISAHIGDRLYKLGPLGTVVHAGRKLSYTFGDGTYFAASKLDRSPATPGGLHEFFVYTGRWFGVTAYVSFAIEAAMLVWMVVAAVKSLGRKNNALTFVRVALFGLLLFLLVWETRSRYLVNYLPLFLLCAAEAAPMPRLAVQRQRARVAAGTGVYAGVPEPEDYEEYEDGLEYAEPVEVEEEAYYDHGQLYYVGAGAGDYSYDESGQPMYVGEGLGDFCYTEEDVLYDESGRQYAFDLNGQPYYLDEVQYDEDGQPYYVGLEHADELPQDIAPPVYAGQTDEGLAYDDSGQLYYEDEAEADAPAEESPDETAATEEQTVEAAPDAEDHAADEEQTAELVLEDGWPVELAAVVGPAEDEALTQVWEGPAAVYVAEDMLPEAPAEAEPVPEPAEVAEEPTAEEPAALPEVMWPALEGLVYAEDEAGETPHEAGEPQPVEESLTRPEWQTISVEPEWQPAPEMKAPMPGDDFHGPEWWGEAPQAKAAQEEVEMPQEAAQPEPAPEEPEQEVPQEPLDWQDAKDWFGMAAAPQAGVPAAPEPQTEGAPVQDIFSYSDLTPPPKQEPVEDLSEKSIWDMV